MWLKALWLRVWSIYRVEKAKANEALPLPRKAAELTISAARDEHEPFIVALGGDGTLRPGRLLQFWLDARIPRDATPGLYEGEVLVRFCREGWMKPDAPTDFPSASPPGK